MRLKPIMRRSGNPEGRPKRSLKSTAKKGELAGATQDAFSVGKAPHLRQYS
jgi:hypothetical protein